MQRHLASALSTALLLCAPLAHAQETDTDLYDGRWNVTMKAADGSAAAASLVVANFGGTWQDQPRKGAKVNKACSGKKFPITVQRSLPERMEFTVWGSSVAPACPDLTVLLKPVDAKTLEGTVNESTTIRIVKR
ncbi:MAG: hypothetical protein ABW069_16645 [Duganella sp.]